MQPKNRLRNLCWTLLIGLGVTFNTADASVYIPLSAKVIANGTLDIACGDLQITGTLTNNASLVDNIYQVAIALGGVLHGGGGVIKLGGDWRNQGTFRADTSTVIIDDSCSSLISEIIDNTTFHNLILRSTKGKVFYLPAGGNITITGKLTLEGTSALPITVTTRSGQPASFNLTNGAALQKSNTNLVAVNIKNFPVAVPILEPFGWIILCLSLVMLSFRRLRIW